MMCDKWYNPIDFPKHKNEENIINIDTDYTLIGKVQSEINDKKDLIIRHWIEFNKDEFKPYISEEIYSFEDIVNRLRKLHEIEKYQLDMKELCYVLSLVEFQAYECVVYSNEKMNLLENLINKLNKQKEILENEKNIY